MAEELIETDDGDVEAPSDLTELEERFCQAYALVESPSYGKITESAIAAGFAAARNAGWRLMRRPRVRERIAKLQQGARARAEKVLSDLEHTRLASMEKNDLATACRCSQLQGQALGLFYERNILSVEDTPTYDPRLAAQAVKITAILLQENPTLEPPPGADVSAIEATTPAAGPARASAAELAAAEKSGKTQVPQNAVESE